MENPRCYLCGKFISTDPKTIGIEWDVRLIWCGGAVPEPSHDEFWHLRCLERDNDENKSE